MKNNLIVLMVQRCGGDRDDVKHQGGPAIDREPVGTLRQYRLRRTAQDQSEGFAGQAFPGGVLTLVEAR